MMKPPAGRDTIILSQATADALSTIGLGDFSTVEQPERLAWVVLVLRHLPDRPTWFPRGKWATIQHIEEVLQRCALQKTSELTE